VAGAASLLLTRYPNLTNVQVERMLQQSSRDIDVEGIDQFTGFGIVNAPAALQADPSFYITPEISGVTVTQQENQQFLQVLGTADADQLKRIWLEIGAGENPTQWKRASSESLQTVKQAVLGSIPAREFAGSPLWIIRLIVEHQNGKTREARFQLRLE
jgi:hypothetical protein